MFSFERLVVYQRAIDFLALSAQVVNELPRGSGFLADQLKRAALSIPAKRGIPFTQVGSCPRA